ncbi:hypothetical protein GS501_06470 [Saccharibacter sp. 17.LH.SD]|uniref:glycosyltransferase family 32 protein n=1 Tax=Saccharibacter sp. 17.LH.SD TaxID=2689393 RepID=UPI00136E67B4|nr:glycosyltransferase [Saccharibacter sp. 17.LH.SD]MXV44686.1 hypothetical protein [Saccharibacter sp. 17.LH.SD]
MFISCFNTYLVCQNGKIGHKFLCAYYDDASSVATEDDLKQAGFEIRHLEKSRLAFFKVDEGYLAVHPDLSTTFYHGVGRREIFRKIDPSILPPPIPVMKLRNRISKNIHQYGVFPSNPGQYPEIFEENRQKITAINPNYNFYFWSEGGKHSVREFILNTYGEEILKYYDSINKEYPSARADLFRLLCIYALGGVYFDLKTTCSYPLDQVIRPDDKYLVSFWYYGMQTHEEVQHITYGEYENYCIICAAGHPIIRHAIQQALCNIRVYDEEIGGVGFYGTLRLAGPLMYSMIIYVYRPQYKDIIRQIHTYSNGIEYTIFSDDAVHRKHYGGRKHYSDIEAPLVYRDAFKEITRE